MRKYLVSITYGDNEVYDEFVITNPEALIELLDLPAVGLIPGGELDA